jgi:ATP phosphoribosyltransferase
MSARPLTVALPKGRLGEQVYGRFAAAGYPCPALLGDSRRLIFETGDGALRYFWAKPSDVAVYVERGAADLGVAGLDLLLEHRPEVYEMLDLGLGRCRMAVAAKHGFRDDRRRTLRVATKFRRIAEDYYASLGRDIDVIHLNGSIELAPLLGLSDVIVDIVETGTTLRENGLAVVAEILPISARLITNKASYEFHRTEIEAIRRGLEQQTEESA